METRIRSEQTNSTRRRLVKALVGTGAALAAGRTLPEKWTQPIVETAIVPAHAQATGMVFGGTGLTVAAAGVLTDDQTRFARWADTLFDNVVPTAHAIIVEPTSTVCALLSGSTLDVTLQRSQNNARRQGLLCTDGTPGTLTVIAQSASCIGTPNSLNAYVSGYVPNTGFTLNVTSGSGFSVYVPLTGSCPGFAPLDGFCTD